MEKEENVGKISLRTSTRSTFFKCRELWVVCFFFFFYFFLSLYFSLLRTARVSPDCHSKTLILSPMPSPPLLVRSICGAHPFFRDLATIGHNCCDVVAGALPPHQTTNVPSWRRRAIKKTFRFQHLSSARNKKKKRERNIGIISTIAVGHAIVALAFGIIAVAHGQILYDGCHTYCFRLCFYYFFLFNRRVKMVISSMGWG